MIALLLALSLPGSIQELKENPNYAVSGRFNIRRPKVLFEQFEDTKFLGGPNCKGAGMVVGQRIMNVRSGNVWTLYVSNTDHCDGGNVYGLAVIGSTASKKKVVNIIKDGDFYEVPK